MYVNYDTLQISNQSLDPQFTKIHDIILKHDISMQRIVPLSTQEDKGYYIMTEFLEPRTIFCSSKKIIMENNKAHYVHDFRLRIKKNKLDIINNDIIKQTKIKIY